MKNIPKFMYLQVGLEQYGESCEDFNELDNISWCVVLNDSVLATLFIS